MYQKEGYPPQAEPPPPGRPPAVLKPLLAMMIRRAIEKQGMLHTDIENLDT